MTFDLLSLAGVLSGLLTLLGTGWWRMTIMIRDSKKEAMEAAFTASNKADLARLELAAHQRHVAESYVHKDGLREVTAQIMGAIGTVNDQLHEMRSRIDKLLDRPTPSSTRRSST